MSYSYDGLDRLREVRQVRVGGLGLLPRRSYSYDQVGNMTRKGSLSLSYTDAAHVHAVTEAGTNRYRYDANGNMIYRDEGNNHRYDQVWRGDNLLERLTWSEQVNGVSNRYEVRLGYDGEGRRLRKWQQGDTVPEASLSLYPLPGYEVDLRWQGREEQSQGEYWNYKVSNHQLVGQGNVANDQIAFYSQPGRVCQNRDRNECVFEARSLYRDKANNLHEIIIAHGRFWHTQWVNGSIQSGADNGQLLTALARFRGSGGPCAGRRGTDCHFESYTRVWLGQNLVESVSAGGRYWNFTVTDTGYTAPRQGKPLSEVPRYRAEGGPCHNRSGNSCVFQAREVYQDGQGRRVEVVLAYNKRWSWTGQGQTRQVREKGVELSNIRRYREGVCAQVTWGRCVIATLAYWPNTARQGEMESLVAGKLKRVVQTRAETGGSAWHYALADQEPWANNGRNVTAVTRYANGPCAGKTVEKCTFDGRTLYKVGQHNREVIIAQGKRWERQQGQAAMTGTALESIRRYQGSGPCGRQAAGKCKFQAYTILRSADNSFWMESIIAQGKYWNFRLDTQALLSHNDLTAVSRYSQNGGPCAGKGRGQCVFQARDIYVDGQGHVHEVVLAGGKKWHWERVGGTRYVRENGVNLKDIPYYRAGPCWGLDRDTACQIDALAFLNHEVESVVTGFNVRAAKWEGTRKYYHFGGQRVAVREGELHYLYGDHLGSTSLTLNAAGQVVGQRRYEAYGQKRWSRGVEQTDFGFNSHREESEFGLYDYQARYFSPLLGRFISADSIVPDFSNPQDLNRYSYVRNNPLKYTDPSGHICVPCLIGVAAAAGYLFFTDEMPVGNGDDTPAYNKAQNYVNAAVDLTPASDVEDAIHLVQDPTMVNGGIFIMAMVLPEGAEQVGKKGADLLDEARRKADDVNASPSSPDSLDIPTFRTTQRHHVFSNKIMGALNDHDTLSGIFQRNDLLTQAATEEAHRGYQRWHRAYDREVTDWLVLHGSATKEEFIEHLQSIYRRSDMQERFPDAVEQLEALK